MLNPMASQTTVPPHPAGSTWTLRDAKERFDELVHAARTQGPQHVMVSGPGHMFTVSADMFEGIKSPKSGALLVAAFQASPYKEIDLTAHLNEPISGDSER